MTISVTTDEAFEPPRNEITVAVEAGGVMTDVAVYRNDSTGRSLIRTQPTPGFDSRTVYDYECPYGQTVTYDWTATYIDPTEYTPSFTEDWSAYPTGWTGDTGLGSEVAGELVWTTPSGSADLTSAASFEWQEIQIASLELTSNTLVSFDIDLTLGTFDRRITFTYKSPTELWVSVGTGISPTTNPTYSLDYDPDQPITLTRTATGPGGVLVSSPIDSREFVMLYGPINRIRFETTGADQGLAIGEIAAVTAGATEEIAEESDPVVLNSARAWLIHPSTVGLSFPLEETSTAAGGIVMVDEIANRTATTLHPILGSAHPIAVTTGIRSGDETGMIIATVTSDERVAVRALLASDTPILIQIPPAWDIDFDSVFYAVGDVREARPSPIGTDPRRQFRMPLTRVQAPVVDVLESTWTFTQVSLTYESFDAVKAAYATFADLATDSRL